MKEDLDTRNSLCVKANKAKWEKEQKAWLREYIKVHGRRPGGTRKVWVYNKDNGAFIVKRGRYGINWYRYQKHILIPKLLPFAKECEKERKGTIVIEDNAPAHASHYQQGVYNLWKIMKMIWPSNSPDLNAIEPTWLYMKKETTKKGATSDKKKLRV